MEGQRVSYGRLGTGPGKPMPFLNSADVFINDCKNVLNKNSWRNKLDYKVCNSWRHESTGKGKVDDSIKRGNSLSVSKPLPNVSRSGISFHSASNISSNAKISCSEFVKRDSLYFTSNTSSTPGVSCSSGKVLCSSPTANTFEAKLEEFLSEPRDNKSRHQSGVTSSSEGDLKYSSFVDDVLSQSSGISSFNRDDNKLCFGHGDSKNILKQYKGSSARFSVTSPTMLLYAENNVRPTYKGSHVSSIGKGVSFQTGVSGKQESGSNRQWSSVDFDVSGWKQKLDDEISALKQGRNLCNTSYFIVKGFIFFCYNKYFSGCFN